MTELTWDFGRLAEVGPGPWTGEPDKVLWVDPTTDLDCMLLRAHHGAWCGYVGVPEGHPWFGVDFWEIQPEPAVHGGLSYSNVCDGEDNGDADAICHVPEPGRSAHVWWIGFDCGHAFDAQPLRDQRLPQLLLDGAEYRTIDYVRDQVTLLAVQAAGVLKR